MTGRRPFSVRDTVLGPGDAADRFRRCFAEGRHFIETTSLRDLLQRIFGQERNRRALAAVVRPPLHVGFLFPGSGLTLEQMGEASRDAGFEADYAAFPSTVVARELGLLSGCGQVPTLIFSAAANGACARPGYVEAFIPEADGATARGWVEDEVASHVGLILSDHAAIRVAHEAFRAEGFEVATFMGGQAIPNPAAGVSVIYYEKPGPTPSPDPASIRTSRIEVLWPMAGVR